MYILHSAPGSRPLIIIFVDAVILIRFFNAYHLLPIYRLHVAIPSPRRHFIPNNIRLISIISQNNAERLRGVRLVTTLVNCILHVKGGREMN